MTAEYLFINYDLCAQRRVLDAAHVCTSITEYPVIHDIRLLFHVSGGTYECSDARKASRIFPSLPSLRLGQSLSGVAFLCLSACRAARWVGKSTLQKKKLSLALLHQLSLERGRCPDVGG